MILHYKVDNKKEKLEISVEDFLKMTPEELSAFDLTSISASRDEIDKIKEHTRQYKEQYATLQQEYGLETSTSSSNNLSDDKKDYITQYIDTYSNVCTFKNYDIHASQLRTDLATQQQKELMELRGQVANSLGEAENAHIEKRWDLEGELNNLYISLQNQENALASLDDQIAEKERQLAELQTQQQEYETELQQRVSPEVLTKAYMTEIHNTFDNSISAIKGKATQNSTIHKRWVTNRAPLDKNGKPMTNFDSNGKVIGTPASYAFPAMNCQGMYGVNYCSLAAVSCINAADKKCGVDILNTDSFDIKIDENETERITPYQSGWENKYGTLVGESLSHRPDSVHIAFGSTPYVSGAEVDTRGLIRRNDGALSIDKRDPKSGYTQKVGTNVLKISGVSLKDIYEKGQLVTDDKTGEKYYSYAFDNGRQTEHVYVKDGDVICIDTPRGATNTTSGFHTIMVNIDQETGKMTYTAGNGDHVREDITTSGYYNCDVSIFHTSEFAYDKISSFDEQTRAQIAQNLNVSYNTTHEDKTTEIEQVQAELEALKTQRESLSNNIEQTKTEIANCQSKISDEKIKFENIFSSIKQEKENNEKALSDKHSNEKTALEESIMSGAMQLFSVKTTEVVTDNTQSVTQEQSIEQPYEQNYSQSLQQAIAKISEQPYEQSLDAPQEIVSEQPIEQSQDNVDISAQLLNNLVQADHQLLKDLMQADIEQFNQAMEKILAEASRRHISSEKTEKNVENTTNQQLSQEVPLILRVMGVAQR